MHDGPADVDTDRSWWGRGVLASYVPVTPSKATDADAARMRLSLRDVLLLLVGCAGMYGAQVARDSGLRSDIRNLQTSFEAAITQQTTATSSLQRQIDEWRAETKLNRVNLDNTDRVLAELKGLLIGAGIKGVQK